MTTFAPTYRPRARAAVQVAVSFSHGLADAIRQIRKSAQIPARTDRKMLDDMARGRGTARIERLAEISRLCTDLGDATALSEHFRTFALAGHRSLALSEREALRVEAQADGEAHVAVFEYLSNKCHATRMRAIEALRAEAEASRCGLDALHRGHTS